MPRRLPDNDAYFVFGSLPVVGNLIQTRGDRITREVTFKQWTLLLVVRDMPPGSSVTQIAAQHGSSRQNIKRMLDVLMRRGYVSVRPDPEDRRGYRVDLTEPGRRLMASVSEVGGRFVAEIFEGIDPADLAAARRVLWQLIENLQTMEVEKYER